MTSDSTTLLKPGLEKGRFGRICRYAESTSPSYPLEVEHGTGLAPWPAIALTLASTSFHTSPIIPVFPRTQNLDAISSVKNTSMAWDWCLDARSGRSRTDAEKIGAGSVWINSCLEVSPSALGGREQSGTRIGSGLSGMNSILKAQTSFLEKY